jgi:response regulator of citrate/malate metabolism
MKYRKVLLIDDDLDDQEIFMMAINEISSEVECIISKNTDEALNKLSKKESIADFIFLELNLPASSDRIF